MRRSVFARAASTASSDEDKAPEGYKHLDAREDGWTKAVIKPAA